MTEDKKNKIDYINLGIQISDTVRSTLGIKGMNKMIIKGDETILTNDGATIIKSIKFTNPIADIFKRLAESQERVIGDGTTTAVILAGQLLTNSLDLLNKRVHPTIIMSGYNLARVECLRYLSQIGETVDIEKIIRSTFGSKLNNQLSEKLTNLLKNEDVTNLKIAKFDNSSEKIELIKGFTFEGHTLNDRTPKSTIGDIAVLDLQSNLELAKFQVTSTDELNKIEQRQRDFKKQIVDKLKELDVGCVFTSDTNPQFENYLTEANLMTIVVYKRDLLDNICRATKARVIGDPTIEFKDHLGFGDISYSGQTGIIQILNEKSDIKTLVINAPTKQILDEIERSIDDVVNVMRNYGKSVVGAGAIEIELSNHLREFSKKIGGVEQIAIEKFAESIEAIPLILAENCGHNALEVLTLLKNQHTLGKKDLGVDAVKVISDARERGIFELASLKMHAINSSTEVANLILKLDDIYAG
jgi:chaperonin GroEL (HSP60 family)